MIEYNSSFDLFFHAMEVKDLKFDGDYVHAFHATLRYEEVKGFLGWKISKGDADRYRQLKSVQLREFNKFVEMLEKNNINYKTEAKKWHSDSIFTDSQGEKARWADDSLIVTVTVSNEKKQWFFKLSKQLGYESLVTKQKELAGSWYGRIKDTETAQEMIKNIELRIDDYIDYAHKNHLESICVKGFIDSSRIYIAGDKDLSEYYLRFQDIGYEDMNKEQVAALRAIFLETARNYCCKQDMILGEDFRYVESEYSGEILICFMYLNEIKKLKSW